jgi:UDP-2-acetamido-3-amino-2,3-dideoxy-glucuronate N-acetyltransferase
MSVLTAVARIAVVGNGYWGRNLVRNFHELDALKLVCDGKEEVERAVHEKYPAISFTRDYSEVLASSDVDAVVLATPAATHFEMARRALLAGKDVLVEKPLALGVSEGAELIELAAARGRILMVGHILRYHPAVRKLQELIARGALGQIQYLYSNRLNMGKIRT